MWFSSLSYDIKKFPRPKWMTREKMPQLWKTQRFPTAEACEICLINILDQKGLSVMYSFKSWHLSFILNELH